MTGNELPGWPVHTLATTPALNYPGINPGHEPILAPVAVGDLLDNGNLDVVVTSTTGRTYVWNAHGVLLPGWPKTSNTGVSKPPIPRPALNYTRLPAQGAAASPVLVSLESPKKQLDVVQAGWDGFFLWDHLSWDGHVDVHDPWVLLAAIATHTSRIRIGTMVTPISRRRRETSPAYKPYTPTATSTSADAAKKNRS